MPKFLEDYVTVQELITKMNEIYPNGSLISDIVDLGEDFVIFKTTFFENKEDEVPKATGFARQHKTDHNSWFEMCQTKSQGRTLRIVFSEDTVAEEMIGIAPSKDSKPVNEANVGVIEGKSEEKSDILGEAAEKNESRTGITREHILKAYANSLKSKAMDLVENDSITSADQKDKAKELYERALQEVGILESELDHNNSEMVRKELENQLESLKR
jgi:hypothetical protein